MSMSESQTAQMAKKASIIRTCPVCGLKGIQRAIELLPRAGILIGLTHLIGGKEKEHVWAKYGSLSELAAHDKKPRNPRTINCPNCHKRGRVNHYIPYKKMPYIVAYYVEHEKLEGTWGKDKVQKTRRCYIKDPEQRTEILKRLKRYIPPPSIDGIELLREEILRIKIRD